LSLTSTKSAGGYELTVVVSALASDLFSSNYVSD